MKVFRNKRLEGVISKKRALQLLGVELSIKHLIGNVELLISRDDMGNVDIDYIVDGEPAGGEFEEI